jgi:hypothetical protein
MPTTFRQKTAGSEGQRFRVRRGHGEKAAHEVLESTSFGLMPTIDKVEAAELTRDHALIMAAEDRGPLLYARVGMLKAMNHGRERVFRTNRKETHWAAES